MSDDPSNPSYPPPPTDLVLLAPADPDEPHGEKRAREDAAATYPVGLDGVGYDASVKRRKDRGRGYTRTGQACDRCKARKVKCDALPEGCSPCATAVVDCFVTDRVTGRTERRGYLQDLERERDRMVDYIRDLEGLIAMRTDLRVQPSPWTGVRLEREGWERVGGVLVRAPGADE